MPTNKPKPIDNTSSAPAAASYAAWFNAKVEAGLKCQKLHSHTEVLQQLKQLRAQRNKKPAYKL